MHHVECIVFIFVFYTEKKVMLLNFVCDFSNLVDFTLNNIPFLCQESISVLD